MEATTALFYIFAVILVFAALRVVTTKNSVHAALYLILSFFTGASIWMLLKAEFLAISLVVVYVGAVMVLFLFVVMMLDIRLDKMREGFWGSLWVAAPVGAIIVFEMSAVLLKSFNIPEERVPQLPADYNNTKALGQLLFTEYVYPFELAGVILLVGIVSAIALTLRRREGTKYNDPSAAVRTRRNDRLKVVKVAPVVREGSKSEGEGGSL